VVKETGKTKATFERGRRSPLEGRDTAYEDKRRILRPQSGMQRKRDNIASVADFAFDEDPQNTKKNASRVFIEVTDHVCVKHHGRNVLRGRDGHASREKRWVGDILLEIRTRGTKKEKARRADDGRKETGRLRRGEGKEKRNPPRGTVPSGGQKNKIGKVGRKKAEIRNKKKERRLRNQNREAGKSSERRSRGRKTPSPGLGKRISATKRKGERRLGRWQFP